MHVQVSDMYEVLSLTEQCTAFAKQQMNEENCCSMWLMAHQLGCMELQHTCLAFMMLSKFEQVAESDHRNSCCR